MKNKRLFEAKLKVLLYEIQALLEENDIKDLVSMAVDNRYISAFCHKRDEEGNAIPDELIFYITEFTKEKEND